MSETPTENKPKLVIECKVYSRVVGFYSPLDHWNAGKVAEWRERRTYDTAKAVEKVLDRPKEP